MSGSFLYFIVSFVQYVHTCSFYSRLNTTKSIISEAGVYRIVLTSISTLRYDTHILLKKKKKPRSLAILPYTYQCNFDLTSNKVHNSSNVGHVDIKMILQMLRIIDGRI